MKIPALLAAGFALICLNAQPATYQDMFNSKASFSVEENSIMLVDVEHPLEKCSINDEFVCIKSRTLNLAIPREASRNKWSFLGGEYKILGRNSTFHQGEIEEYQIIKVTGVYKFQMAYSRRRGVLAIKEPSGNILLLQGRCGILVQESDGTCN